MVFHRTENNLAEELWSILGDKVHAKLVNRPNRMGETPLHIAEQNWKQAKLPKQKETAERIISILLKSGAQLLHNSKGELP